MTGRRIGAVLVAVALVAGAVLLRRNVIDGGDDDTDGTVPVTAVTSTPAAALVCITELQAACEAVAAADDGIAVVVEPASVTLDRLAALPDDADLPLWLTIEPFPGMLDELRATAGSAPTGSAVDVLAASQLSVATPTGGRSATLDAACAGVALWRCIGERAGEPWTELGGDASWNTVRPSLGVVERDGVALASFASAVAGYFGTPTVSRSAWEADPAFVPWLRRLAGTVDESAVSAGTPLATMAIRPALDVAATTEAERSALGGDRFDVNYPDPTMWVEAVLSTPDGVRVPDDLATAAADALTASGWSDAATATQAVPGASTMLGLRALWAEAT